ncbi:MAG: bifunctional aspartate kinase/homoserine dehydrogenase I, partial [Flavobacterium sp.]|nr:bifunctional aspartate kinase/homoserine dehydrogenase I [Flavobacterium sp.]
MKVLKFGGTSVANAQNIKLVLEIVEQKSKEDKLIVAVSAFSGVTDLLLSAAQKAASKDDSYRDVVLQIEKKHLEAIKELVPANEQTALLHYCKKNIS